MLEFNVNERVRRKEKQKMAFYISFKNQFPLLNRSLGKN